MTRQEERDEFIAILMQELSGYSPHEVMTLARTLMRKARTHQTHQERMCSEEMSERAAEELSRRDDANEAAIAAACEKFGVGVVFSGDPRGATVKLTFPSGRTNDWGRIGVCVPAGN